MMRRGRSTAYGVMTSRLITLLIVGMAAFCLYRGVTAPLAEFTKLFFFSSSPSLIEIVEGLWQSDDRLLACLVALFSIVLPCAKILGLLFLLTGLQLRKASQIFQQLGRWAMLDVLLVALAIFAAKTSGLASAATQPGLWWFIGAITLTALAGYRLKN